MNWELYCQYIDDEINDHLGQFGLGLVSQSPAYQSNLITCWINSGHWSDSNQITPKKEFELTDSIKDEVMKFANETIEIWNSPLAKAMREE